MNFFRRFIRRDKPPKTYRVPLESANHILATFGLTQSTEKYERRIKDNGFELNDFRDVLFEAPFIFTIDWRSWLCEELHTVAGTLDRLGVSLKVELDEEGNSGYVSCGLGRRAFVAHRFDDDYDGVFQGLQSVVPPNIEFRSSPSNDGADTWTYAVLTRDEWADLEAAAPEAINAFFRPLSPIPKS